LGHAPLHIVDPDNRTHRDHTASPQWRSRAGEALRTVLVDGCGIARAPYVHRRKV